MRPSPHDLQGHVRETLPRAPDDSAEPLLIDDTVAMRRQDVRDQEDLLLPRLPEAVDMSRQRCPEAPEPEQSTDPQKSPSPEPTVRSEPETVEEAEANGPPTSPDPIWTLRGCARRWWNGFTRSRWRLTPWAGFVPLACGGATKPDVPSAWRRVPCASGVVITAELRSR